MRRGSDRSVRDWFMPRPVMVAATLIVGFAVGAPDTIAYAQAQAQDPAPFDHALADEPLVEANPRHR